MNLSETVAVLARNPLFQRMGESRTKLVALNGEVQRLRDGETLFHRGEEGDAAYVVLQGAVLVRIPIDGVDQTVARLGAGELFGELAVLCGRPRSSAIVSEGETDVLRLGAAELRTLVAELPELSMELIRSLADRLENTSEELARVRRAGAA